jgi:hypothetical protein
VLLKRTVKRHVMSKKCDRCSGKLGDRSTVPVTRFALVDRDVTDFDSYPAHLKSDSALALNRLRMRPEYSGFRVISFKYYPKW